MADAHGALRFGEGVAGRADEIEALFAATFAASEGPDEGAVIGGFVRRLLAGTPLADIRVYQAEKAGVPVGAAVFTRLRFGADPRVVFILSPMAVATGRQGQGVGQALLRHALAALRAEGVDIAMTYGDPAFYGRVGFAPVTVGVVPPPLPLSMPEGWIGQALDGGVIAPLPGPCTCAEALNDPSLW